MSKKYRQYIGIGCAIVAYYLVHEGAHALYALWAGAFKAIRLVGAVGVQVDIYRERLSDVGLGLFCLAGPMATLAVAWCLVVAAHRIAQWKSSVGRAVAYYVTLVLLLLDPLYLGAAYRLVGGGDMNGIALILPEMAVSAVSLGLLVLHGLVFFRHVVPTYSASFKKA